MKNQEIQYKEAQKRVRKVKGFYRHAIIYLVVNIFILVVNFSSLKEGESFFHWNNLSTAFFWGIGLMAHGISAFLPNIIFSKEWEERKIKELIEKEKLSRRDN